jgi:hypothetical protein
MSRRLLRFSLLLLLAGPLVAAGQAADDAEAGWIELMDPAHWRVFGAEDSGAGWVFADGVLALVEPGAGDIVSRESFGDFELVLEWRISACGNSGIFFRGDPEREPWATSPEMQVLDDTCDYGYDVPDTWKAGAVFDLYAPPEGVVRPVGEWNEVRILAHGPHTELWLNGVKVAEYEQGSDEWNERIANSKFHDWDGFGLYFEGPISLQDHGDPVWYRNIRIRRLG